MLKAHGLVPVAGEKRRATADPEVDELKEESGTEDDDAEIRALKVNCLLIVFCSTDYSV
jgi:hypothetical protein